MKKMFRKTAMAVLLSFMMLPGYSQIITLDFEEFSLPADSFWNGSDGSGGFSSYSNFFRNSYFDWGGGIISWDGFAYSNMYNDTTQAFTNMYSNFAGNNSNNTHALSYLASDWINYNVIPNFIRLSSRAVPISIQITNSTYTALTMQNGDFISKEFGGITGDDPDWCKLSIFGMIDGTSTDSINFYLADYRFSNNNEDYIVKDWAFVNLSNFGPVDSIGFIMSSSDTGTYGMNTPAIFCFDNLILDYSSGTNKIYESKLLFYPNPASDFVIIPGYSGEVTLTGMDGKVIINKYINERLDMSALPEGMYIIQADQKRTIISKQ